MSTDQTSDIPRRELWRPDETEIGFDLGIAAEDIFLAAGIMVYCDEDPFRTDCMHAVMRRLKAMTAKRPDVPTTEERLEAVERLQQVAQELRTVIKNKKPIDYAKAYELVRIDIERQEASDEED